MPRRFAFALLALACVASPLPALAAQCSNTAADFEGLSQSEIATQLGLPLGTVKGRVRLALERLRMLVNDEAAING